MDDNDDDDKTGGGTLVIQPSSPGSGSGSGPPSQGHGTTVIPAVGPRGGFAPLATAETELSMRAVQSLKSTEPMGFANRLPSQPVLQRGSYPSGSGPHPGLLAAPPRASAPGPEHGDYDWSQPQPGLSRELPRDGVQQWNDPALEPAPRATGQKRGLLAMGIGALAAMVVMIGFAAIVLISRGGAPEQGAPSASSAAAPAEPAPVASAAQLAPSAVTSSPSSSPTSATPATGPDAEAIAGLEQLRDGIALCVNKTIRRLPGTSSAVPESLAWLKSGPYASLKRDWETPFFHCTKVKIVKPMPYMMQWQVDQPGRKGTGIAWLDSDADGSAERAYAFTGTLTDKGLIEFTAIEPSDAKRKPIKR